MRVMVASENSSGPRAVIPVPFGRQRQENCHVIEYRLVYIVSSRQTRDTWKDTVSGGGVPFYFVEEFKRTGIIFGYLGGFTMKPSSPGLYVVGDLITDLTSVLVVCS